MIQGLHVVRSVRAGKPIRWYIYAYRGGPQIRVVEQPARPRLTSADVEAVAKAQADLKVGDIRVKNTVHGLSTEWQKSREWNEYAASTRQLWGDCAGKIETKWGDVPLQVLGDPRMMPKIVRWQDEMAEKNGLRTADKHVKVLSQMLGWGLLRGLVASNPAALVPRVWKGGNREEIIWTAEDCAAFDATEKMPRYLIDLRRLAEFTGLRRADLCALRWDEVSDTHIARMAAKKSAGKRRRTVMPIVPGLRELLEELRTRFRKPGVETVLVGAKGGSLAPATVTSQFNKYRNMANGGAGIVQRAEHVDERDRAKHLHDLRGTFATKLMTNPTGSLSDSQIAMIMGWGESQVSAIRKRYVDETAIIVAIGRSIGGRL